MLLRVCLLSLVVVSTEFLAPTLLFADKGSNKITDRIIRRWVRERAAIAPSCNKNTQTTLTKALAKYKIDQAAYDKWLTKNPAQATRTEIKWVRLFCKNLSPDSFVYKDLKQKLDPSLWQQVQDMPWIGGIAIVMFIGIGFQFLRRFL